MTVIANWFQKSVRQSREFFSLPPAMVVIANCTNCGLGSVERYPEGFPRIAAYIDSDIDTVLFRRFGRFNARILLYREVELNELEKKLDELDKKDNAEEDTEWRVGHGIHHEDGKKNEERKALIEEGERKLKAYCICSSTKRKLRTDLFR